MVGRIRTLGLCLVAALSLGALSAAGAQASAEITARCFKTAKGANHSYHGHYLNKTCTEEASAEEIGLGGKSNKYEFGFGETWSAKGAALKLVTAQGPEVKCVKSAGSGTILGPARVEATFTFSKCGSLESICTTPGLKSGYIATKPLIGVVGENGDGEVQVSFTGKEANSTEPAPAETFAEFDCLGEAVHLALHGTLSGKWTEAPNKLTKTGGIEFAAGTGEQGLIEQFPNITSGETEEEAATLELTQRFKFKDQYELKQG
ncbi:MAG TPA: hypothetical protein VMB91_13970 [Solirubrobacteraceae bacterium]|nr:hypothetical protein [Solirubrobacteraceae bacterium]